MANFCDAWTGVILAGPCDAPRDGLRVTGLESRDVRRNFDGVGANRRRPLLTCVEQDHRRRRIRSGGVVDVVPAELSNKYWPFGVEPTSAWAAPAPGRHRATSLNIPEAWSASDALTPAASTGVGFCRFESSWPPAASMGHTTLELVVRGLTLALRDALDKCQFYYRHGRA